MSQLHRPRRGIIAAGHPLTAQAGADVLAAGGNAIDAAIAALAMSCLVEPVLSSPGGGGFAMIRRADTGRRTLVDFFPHTPKGHNPALAADGEPGAGVDEVLVDFGTATQAFRIGPATTATPGFPAGVRAMSAQGATMGLSDLFAPAVDAARAGVTITEFQHRLATVVEPILTATPEARDLFAPGGSLLPVGARFTNPGLADALELLAKETLADSSVGDALLAAQADSGHITGEDLADYRAIVREPLTVTIGAATAHLNPAPSAGGTLIAHSLAQLASTGSGDPLPLRLARAFASTVAERDRLVEGLIRAKGTTHVSVIDAAGNGCAVTVSNGEGNGALVGGFGFMANNILGEEDVNPSGVDWPTDTRLSSMMCPTLVEHDDGGLTLAGSGGSNRIRTAVAQVLARICLNGESIPEAVSAPRLHVEATEAADAGAHLDFEDLFPSDVADRLRAEFPDHLAWPEPNLFYGGVHTVGLDTDGNLSGAGDARRDGTVVAV